MVVLNARNPGTLTGPGNNTYLLRGRVPTLIDAGVGDPVHVSEISKALDGKPLAQVLLTHGHPDHASGVPALTAHWPTLTVLRWPAIGEGDEVDAGDGRVTVVHTPGHAVDHVCFWDPVTRGVFCGDMMTRTTTIMVPPRARGGSLRAYLDSLRRLRALSPVVAWPGHGDSIDAPIDRIDHYLAHRAERQRQVQACLDAGIDDTDTIVARVYADVPEDLWPAARLTVEALLEMLRGD